MTRTSVGWPAETLTKTVSLVHDGARNGTELRPTGIVFGSCATKTRRGRTKEGVTATTPDEVVNSIWTLAGILVPEML